MMSPETDDADDQAYWESVLNDDYGDWEDPIEFENEYVPGYADDDFYWDEEEEGPNCE